MQISVIGVDPGETTGICELVIENGTISQFHIFQFDFFQLCTHFTALSSWAREQEDLTVACELFTITPKTPSREAHWSIEHTGIAKEWAWRYGANWYTAKPASTKPLITDDVLKAGNLYRPGKPHSMDATRVALHYLLTQRKILTELLRGPDGEGRLS